MIRIFKNTTTKFVYIDQVAFGPSEDFTLTDNGDGTINIFRENSGEFEAKNLRWQTVRDKSGDAFSTSAELISYLTDVFTPDVYYNAEEIDEIVNPQSDSSNFHPVAISGDYEDLSNKPTILDTLGVNTLINAALGSVNSAITAVSNALTQETTDRIAADDALQNAINNLPIGTQKSRFKRAQSGRFYFETDNRWVTESDDQYGSNTQNQNESGGSGANPIVEWEHIGTFLEAGTNLKKLTLTARASSSEITDMEISIQLRKPNLPAAWQTGVDDDGEMNNTEIFRENFVELGWLGDMQDRRRKVIDLSSVAELTEDSEISIYLKPVGVITARRYLFADWVLDYEL